jgi:hypothetical protein
VIEIMRPAVDAASDDWRLSGHDPFAFEEDRLRSSEVEVGRREMAQALVSGHGCNEPRRPRPDGRDRRAGNSARAGYVS